VEGLVRWTYIDPHQSTLRADRHEDADSHPNGNYEWGRGNVLVRLERERGVYRRRASEP